MTERLDTLRAGRLIAIMRLLIVLVRFGGGQLDAKRLPDAEEQPEGCVGRIRKQADKD